MRMHLLLEYGLEARGSAYFPVSDTYRHIYGTVGPAFALEGFGKIRNTIWGWTNLQWVPKHGNSIGGKRLNPYQCSQLEYQLNSHGNSTKTITPTSGSDPIFQLSGYIITAIVPEAHRK